MPLDHLALVLDFVLVLEMLHEIEDEIEDDGGWVVSGQTLITTTFDALELPLRHWP